MYDEEIGDNFVRSCAGYCVISFLLGIGDRWGGGAGSACLSTLCWRLHVRCCMRRLLAFCMSLWGNCAGLSSALWMALTIEVLTAVCALRRHLENLMLTTSGKLFHIDFEYILGHDPKPFSPPMRLSRQMVMAMGGANSPQFVEFQKYCCKAYLVLRRSARTFLALLELTKHLLPSGTGPGGPGKSGHQIALERFKLGLTSEEAVEHMQEVIHQSLSAVFPQLVDTVHKWRQFFKQ